MMSTLEDLIQWAAETLEQDRHFGWFALGMGAVFVVLVLLRLAV